MRTKAKQDRFEARRLEIIGAAARVFARLGFHGASVHDLAEEMKTTPGAIYYYVESKEDLLRLASEIATEQLEGLLAECAELTDMSAVERLKFYFRRYAEFTCADFGRCLVLTNAKDLAFAGIENHLESRRNLDHAARDLIREGFKDGSIRPCSETLLAAMLYGTANSMARWWQPGGPLSPGQVMDQAFAILDTGWQTDDAAKQASAGKSARGAPRKAARA